MSMFVVLLEADEGEVTVGSRAIDQLAHLGVTSLALLRDERTACVVLDGWAFDPARSSDQVVSAISAGARSTRALHSVMFTAVQASSSRSWDTTCGR